MKNITFITSTIALMRTELIRLITGYIVSEKPHIVGFPDLPIIIDKHYNCEQIKIDGNGSIEAKCTSTGDHIFSNLYKLSTDDLIVVMKAINKIK